jgi:hypothetical protein
VESADAVEVARQGRFRHRFEPRRQDDVLRALQADVDCYWAAVGDAHA